MSEFKRLTKEEIVWCKEEIGSVDDLIIALEAAYAEIDRMNLDHKINWLPKGPEDILANALRNTQRWHQEAKLKNQELEATVKRLREALDKIIYVMEKDEDLTAIGACIKAGEIAGSALEEGSGK